VASLIRRRGLSAH